MSANIERSEENPDIITVNMGPSHPATHGVLRIVLQLNGEEVVRAVPHLGYLHRGIEKLSENRNWTQIILLTDRMDYVAAATSNVGYCETVEKLMLIQNRRGSVTESGSRAIAARDDGVVCSVAR